jgi:hypothetical protein
VLTVPDFQATPVQKYLEIDPEVFITVRPASLMDESRRMEYGFGGRAVAPALDVMLAEIWTTLEECNIQRENGEPLFTKQMAWDDFSAAATALWDLNPDVLFEMQKYVREVNPKWGDSDEDPT